MKILAKKKGIQEEEAKLLLESLKTQDDFDEIKQSLTAIADVGEIITHFPSNIQPLAVPLLAQTMQSSSRAEKIAENIALISAAIKAAYSDDGTKLIEELRKEIQELKEEKIRKEQEEMLKQVEQTFQSVTDYIKALERKIEQLESQEKRDELDELESYLDRVEKTKEKLKRLGLIKEKEEESIDISKAEEVLKKAGYKIERPLTWDSLQKYIDEQMKKIREEAKKEAMEELKIEEKRLTLITDFITTVAGAAIDALSVTETETEGKAKIKRRFEEWRQALKEAEAKK